MAKSTGTGALARLVSNVAASFSVVGHKHSASDVASGTLDAARIPSLPASKIGSGTLAEARIPSLPASKIGSGKLAKERIPTITADMLDGSIPTGEKGDDGEAAGFGTPTATVDGTSGTPTVTVSASGPDTAKVFSFSFAGLKGEKGDKGDKGDAGSGGGSDRAYSEAYAVLDSGEKSLTFFRDEAGRYANGDASGNLTYFAGFEGDGSAPWLTANAGAVVESVRFVDPVRPASIRQWFYEFKMMTSCDLGNLDTSAATSFAYAFHGAWKIQYLDLSGLDPSSCTSFECMFNGCSSLSQVNAPWFDKTLKVTSMADMFHNTSRLTSVNGLETWWVHNVTSMRYMFYSCNLYRVDLSLWNTRSLETKDNMFLASSNNYAYPRILILGPNSSGVADGTGVPSACNVVTVSETGTWLDQDHKKWYGTQSAYDQLASANACRSDALYLTR